MWRALPPLALLLAACQLVLDGDGRECEADLDCFDDQRCMVTTGRCLAGPGAEPAPDAATRADAALTRDAAVDAAVEPDAEVEPDAAPDMAVPDEARFVEGCFEDERSTFRAMPPGTTHTPRLVCSPWLRAWTEPAEGDQRLHVQTDPAGAVELAEWRGAPLAGDARMLAVGRSIVLPLRNDSPTGNGQTNLLRYDALDGEAEWLVPRAAAQSDPAHHSGLLAFVEARTGGERAVVLVEESGLVIDCATAEQEQWGVALTGDGAWWLERRVGRRSTQLVTTGRQCGRRFVYPLRFPVEPDARLHLGEGWLAWRAERCEDGARCVRVFHTGAPQRGDQALSPAGGLELNPVELAARGRWLAVVSYRRGRYALELVDPLTGDVQRPANTGGDTARPGFVGEHLVWAEQPGATSWEIRHARVD